MGSGNASGELLLSLENQAMTLQSNLVSKWLSSHVDLLWSPERISGQGFINVFGYQLDLVSSESSMLNFIGQEKLQSWQGYFDGLQKRLDISGDLSNLNKNVQGQAQMVFDPSGLTGNLNAVTVGNLVLGDMVISPALKELLLLVIILRLSQVRLVNPKI